MTMRFSIALLLVFLCYNVNASTRESLERAFEQDDFKISKFITYKGMNGALALSNNATNLRTGLPKKVNIIEN